MVEKTCRYLRKIDRLPEWRKPVDHAEWQGRIPAACLRDLDDKSSSPSFYRVASDEDIWAVATALELTRLRGTERGNSWKFQKIAALLFTISALECDSVLENDVGNTPCPDVNQMHWCLRSLSSYDHAKVLGQIHSEIMPFDAEGSWESSGVLLISPLALAETAGRLLQQPGSLNLKDEEELKLRTAVEAALGRVD